MTGWRPKNKSDNKTANNIKMSMMMLKKKQEVMKEEENKTYPAKKRRKVEKESYTVRKAANKSSELQCSKPQK